MKTLSRLIEEGWSTLVKNILVYKNQASKMKFFGAKEFFYIKFDFKNGCENEF